MDANAILEKLSSLGISMTLIMKPEGPKLWLEPGSAIPPELLSDIKAHKQELMTVLKLKGYRIQYPDASTPDQEVEEIAARVLIEGYCLLWSPVLCDLVAFYADDEARYKIPLGFVPYSVFELSELFGKGKSCSNNGLRLIHEAKKQGARVISHEPEQSNEKGGGEQ